ncbi:hypothetical protein [Mobiluncus curtisii]|uniref:hypothetical protein n=1 Tax=Mobiluncus curtisii TaxID=2051 RepID=UPI0020934A40|nr:hypothetical protein [Mobiluncus curtisii]
MVVALAVQMVERCCFVTADTPGAAAARISAIHCASSLVSAVALIAAEGGILLSLDRDCQFRLYHQILS